MDNGKLKSHYGQCSWGKSNYGRGGMSSGHYGKAGHIKPKPPSDNPFEKAIKRFFEFDNSDK